jgi:hypothetical protein
MNQNIYKINLNPQFLKNKINLKVIKIYSNYKFHKKMKLNKLILKNRKFQLIKKTNKIINRIETRSNNLFNKIIN